MKILILGSSGYLGSYLNINFRNIKTFKIIKDRIKNKRVKLTDFKILEKLLLLKKPKLIINCAGQTNIDECEKKKDSRKINVLMIKNLFILKNKHNLNFKLIHFSSDQIYDHPKKANNNENIKPFSKNEYTKQKIESENICIKNKALVFRINLIGKSKSKKVSFTDWIYLNLHKNNSFFGFVDSIYSPISLKTITIILMKILKRNLFDKTGIYNLGSRGSITKYLLIRQFSDLLGFKNNKKIIKKKINSVCKTKRSRFNHMNITKFEKHFKMMLPNLKDEIILVAKEYR